MTQLHLVGGFLGSGKTTAIIQAARLLLDRGLRAGVITNDQGKFLVDTAFVRLADLPAVEVGGGCFCCNYDALDERLDSLIAAARPDVIFAESVGSCADIVATVIKPLLALRDGAVRPASFSVFADSRLLRRRLRGEEMPFSEAVLYLYDQQLAEAGLIVANKIDLLSAAQRDELLGLLAERFPTTPALAQCSLDAPGAASWLAAIASGAAPLRSLPDLDYTRYGAGEALLAWLDARYTLDLPGPGGEDNRIRLAGALAALRQALSARQAGIGHVKFLLGGAKVSLTAIEEPGWQQRLPALPAGPVDMLVNARAELPAAALEQLLREAFQQAGVGVAVEQSLAFHPPQPNPTHRMG